MSQPLLITLETGGWDAKIHEKTINGKQFLIAAVAMHDPVAHMIGQTCVRIHKPPKDYLPLLNYRSIFKALEHENIHHELQEIFSDSNEDTLDDLLCSLPKGHVLKKRLGFGV